MEISHVENKEQTEKEIEKNRSEYIEKPDSFSKQNTEIVLESVDTKQSLDEWIQKTSKLKI